MSYKVELNLNPYREHFELDSQYVAPQERHWMLDHAAARDMLKTVLRKKSPELQVPVFGQGYEFDDQLGQLVLELGLSDMPKPTNALLELRATAKFFKMMLTA